MQLLWMKLLQQPYLDLTESGFPTGPAFAADLQPGHLCLSRSDPWHWSLMIADADPVLPTGGASGSFESIE